ncbi:MAG: hypothetical protein K6B14_09155 [Lachnospiraceae bacterium]|nr:hypothetical protein [Lachnospiraceae bacterium]
MANSEDYLDGLLDSITKAKTDNDNAAESEMRERDIKVKNRNRISADDDFLEANGLSDYEPSGRRSRSNLRGLFGDSELLSDIVLDGDLVDDDEFLKEFEEGISDEDLEMARTLEGDSDPYDGFMSTVKETVSEERKKAINLEDFALDDLEKELDDDEPEADAFESVDDESEAETEPAGSIEDDMAALQDILGDESADGDEEDMPQAVPEESMPMESIEMEGMPESLEMEAMPEMPEMEGMPEMPEMPKMEGMPESLDMEAIPEMDAPAEPDMSAESFDEAGFDGMPEMEEIPMDMAEGAFGEGQEITPDALEAADTLMDESGDGMDLMDMLSDGDDLMGDIGALLNADDNLEELSEARSEFENSANELAEAGTSLEAAPDGTAEEKPAGIGGIIAKIKGFFAGFLSDDDEDEMGEDGLINVAPADPTMVELAAEDADILEHFTDADGEGEGGALEEEDPKARKKREKEEKKAAKQAEKEAKKAEKEAAKAAKAAAKAAKPKKEKKPKEPDNSPKVPIKGIIINAVLGISVVVLITIAGKTIHSRHVLARANNYYEKGDYAEAAIILDGMKLDKDSDEAKLALKARILSKLEHKIAMYDQCMKYHDYRGALDALVSGTYDYVQNREAADDLKIREALDALGIQIEGQLMDQFGVSEHEAMTIYRGYSRIDYTKELDKILVKTEFK